MQRYRWFTIRALLGLMIAFGWTGFRLPSAHADNTLLRVVAPDTPQSTTEPVQVWLEIENAADLAGWEFDLEYDHSLATLTAITLTNFVGETGLCDPATDRCTLPMPLKTLVNATAVGSYSYGAEMGGNGDGLLVYLTFQPTGKTGQTPLHITNPLLANTTGTPLVPDTADGFLQFGVPTGVTLATFTVEPRPTDLLVVWETASEINTLGFNLYRSTNPDNLGTQLNSDLIPSQSPGGGQGAYYEWADDEVAPTITYYYWLEDLDMQGNTTLHGPVSGTFGAPTAVETSDLQVNNTDNLSPIQMVAMVILAGLTLLIARLGWLHSARATRTFFLLIALALLAWWFAPLTHAAPSITNESADHTALINATALIPPLHNGEGGRGVRSADCFSRDLTCDHAVDETDLSLESQQWHCASGDACYESRFDFDADGQVTIVDLQLLASHYDRTPPLITITSPADGAIFTPPAMTVSGTVNDAHEIVGLTVNGLPASLTEDDFSVSLPLQGGNQTITVIAEDELGATSSEMVVVKGDNTGPLVSILSPADRQSQYTDQPYIEIQYKDFLSSIELTSLQITLTAEGDSPADITAQLTVETHQAYGYVTDYLTISTVYTLTVSLADMLGNTTIAHSTFYIPPDPYSIPQPSITEGGGWLTGVVYDSGTCDDDLKGCEPLKGVTVSASVLEPVERYTYSLYGEVVTGPDGFFAFPFSESGSYALRFEKEGFTYGQREVNVVRGHSTAANAIYLTPFDPAVTPCDSSGCTHESADGQMRVIVPAGAIPEGQSLDVTATLFDRVNFLPGGELPPGTQETYAFNLSGESDFEFDKPVTIQVQNYRSFDPGTMIPLGLWNSETLQWNHAGTGKVEPTGEWLIIEVTHFSMYDCNDPMVPPDPGSELEDETEEEEKCVIASPGCLILPKSGTVQEWIDDLPTVDVLGEPVAPVLRYSTARANPSGVIDIQLNINPDPEVIDSFDPYIFYEVYIEGTKTDEFTLALNYEEPGEVGRYRYYWDGRNALGEQLPPGVYEFGVKVTFSFVAEYCYSLNGVFGNPPDCEFGRTGRIQRATASEWMTGTVELNGQFDSPYGAGWVLEGQQELFRDEAGHVLVTDGEALAEYYTELGDTLRGRGYYNIQQPPVSGPAMTLPFIPSPAGGTYVGGEITTDTTWTFAGSPYKIVGDDLTVSEGVTLTIEPGVQILTEKERDFRILGNLQAVGTASQPITMTLYAEPMVDSFDPVSTYLYGTTALSVDSNGEVWYAGTLYSYSSGIALWHIAADGTQTELLVPPERQVGSFVYDLAHDANDNIYLATNQGAAFYDDSTDIWTVYRTDTSPIPSNDVQAMAVDTDSVWFATSGGVAHLVPGTGVWTLYTDEDGLASNNVLAVTIAPDGSTWFGTDGGLSIRSSAGTWTTYTTGNSPILGNIVNKIAFDADGNGWLAIEDYGISILSATTTWSNYTPSNSGLYEGDVSALLVAGTDYKWFGHPFNGVSYLKQNDTLWYNEESPTLPGEQVRDFAVTPDGTLWIAFYNEATLTKVSRVPVTTPTISGGWWDLTLNGAESSVSHLSYVTIEAGGFDEPGGLNLYSSAPTLENLTIRASGGHGIYGQELPALTLNNVTIALNDEDGIHLEDDVIIGTLTDFDGEPHHFSNVMVRDNNRDALFLDDGMDVDLTDSTLRRNDGYGIYSRNSGDITVLNSTIDENGVAARVTPTSDLTGASWNANKRNELEWTGGILEGIHTWGPVIGGFDTFRVVDHITVEDGAFLTITPGTAILFENGSGLTVLGRLNAVGDENNVVYFGPGEASDWSALQIGGGAEGDSNASRLRYVVVERGQLKIVQTTPAIFDHITVHDAYFTGVWVFDSPDLVISDCNLVGNGNYGLYNDTPNSPVTAINCYWGNPTGPFHPLINPKGLGQEVSDGVSFTPWRLKALLMERFRPVVRNNTSPDQSAMRYDFEGDTYTRYYPDGREVQFDVAGRHLYTLKPDGRKISYDYNPDGSLATMSITAPERTTPDWVWVFAYSDGKLNAITDPAGRTTNFTIDANGQLTEVELLDTSTRRFFYDERSLLTQQEDRTGDITTYVYDDLGRLATHIGPPRSVTDPFTGESAMTQEVRTYEPSDTTYLLNGTDVGDPDNPAPTPPQSDMLVDTITLERGELTGHTNAFGLWLDSTDALGRTIHYEYDSENNLTRIVEPDGDCAEFSYDGNGNLLTEQRMGSTQCQRAPGDRDPAQIQQWVRTYEARFNNLKTETDPLGRTTIYTYDYEVGMGERNKLVRVELPPVDDGTGTIVTPVIQYTYNSVGQRETVTDARGTVTKYVYTQGIPDEAAGGTTPYFRAGITPIPGILVQRIEDFGDGSHENLTSTFTDLDASGNPGRMTGPGGDDTTTFTYDSQDRVIAVMDAIGILMTYTYDTQGNLIKVIEDYTADGTTGRNIVTHFTYDAENRLLTEQTIDGTLTVQSTNRYDVNGLLAGTTDGLGHTTFYTYDAADQLINERDAAGESISHTYSVDGRRSTTTDEDGYLHRWLFDGLGRMVQSVRDAGGLNLITTLTYDLANNLLTITDPTGAVICYNYDSHNRVATETYDCGGMNLHSHLRYDVKGNLLSSRNWSNVVDRYSYDALGRPILTRWDDGGFTLETSQNYDERGNLVSSTDSRNTLTTFAYDELNRITERCEDANGMNQCTAFGYDRLGNVATMTDPGGQLFQNHHNAFGLITEQIADEGEIDSITRITYDNALNPITVTDPNGTVTTSTYSPRDELILESFADGTTLHYGYDGRGNLTLTTQQDGTTIAESYDGAGRHTSRTFSTGGFQTFTYDAVGRLTGAEQTLDGNVILVSHHYNPIGDLITETQSLNGEPYTVSYAYDYLNDEYTTTYPSGVQRRVTLDTLGRISEVANETSTAIATYQYNIPDGISTIGYGNGVTTSITYDRLYRTTAITSPLADYRYGYDMTGNVTFKQRAHQPDQPADVYRYDGLDRVTQVWYGADATTPEAITTQDQLQEYELDATGNRLVVRNDAETEFYGPSDGVELTDPMHRYQQVVGIPFTYDARGNLLDDGINSYEYDLLNRQIGMAHGTVTADYLYDALGRRVAKVVMDGVTSTTRYLYDKNYQVLEERDGTGTLTARYTYGNGLDEPLTLERGGNTHYYHRDALGNVTEISSDTGVLLERYEYDIYGQVTIYNATDTPIAESALGNPYLFTGRRLDGESGNYEYRNRIYSPGLGRFLQTDPLGTADSYTRYAYTGNNPTNFVDPMGLKGKSKGAPGGVKTIKPVHNPEILPEVLNLPGNPGGNDVGAFTLLTFRALDNLNGTTLIARGDDPVTGQFYDSYKGKSCCERDIDQVTFHFTLQIFYKEGVSPEAQSGYGRGRSREDVQHGNTSLRFHEQQHVADILSYINLIPPPEYVLPARKAPSGHYTCAAVEEATYEWKKSLVPYYNDIRAYTFEHTDCAGLTNHRDCFIERLAREFKPPVPIKLPPKPKGKGKNRR